MLQNIHPFAVITVITRIIKGEVDKLQTLSATVSFHLILSWLLCPPLPLLVLFTSIGLEGLEGLLRAMEGNNHVLSLSLCYCGLGAWSGSPLASFVTNSVVR